MIEIDSVIDDKIHIALPHCASPFRAINLLQHIPIERKGRLHRRTIGQGHVVDLQLQRYRPQPRPIHPNPDLPAIYPGDRLLPRP